MHRDRSLRARTCGVRRRRLPMPMRRSPMKRLQMARCDRQSSPRLRVLHRDVPGRRPQRKLVVGEGCGAVSLDESEESFSLASELTRDARRGAVIGAMQRRCPRQAPWRHARSRNLLPRERTARGHLEIVAPRANLRAQRIHTRSSTAPSSSTPNLTMGHSQPAAPAIVSAAVRFGPSEAQKAAFSHSQSLDDDFGISSAFAAAEASSRFAPAALRRIIECAGAAARAWASAMACAP